MIRFDPIDEYLELDGISLPIRSRTHPDGKDYTILPPDALTGLEVIRLVAASTSTIDDVEMQLREVAQIDDAAGGNLEARVLGPALDEMIADGVPWPMVKLAFQTTMTWISLGAEVAARFWGSGGGMVGKAPSRPTRQPTRKGRRASTASKPPTK